MAEKNDMPADIDADLDETANLLARASWELDNVDEGLAQEIIGFLVSHGRHPADGARGELCPHCGELTDPVYACECGGLGICS